MCIGPVGHDSVWFGMVLFNFFMGGQYNILARLASARFVQACYGVHWRGNVRNGTVRYVIARHVAVWPALVGFGKVILIFIRKRGHNGNKDKWKWQKNKKGEE